MEATFGSSSTAAAARRSNPFRLPSTSPRSDSSTSSPARTGRSRSGSPVSSEEQYVRTIDEGRALYVGYHHTFEPTDALAERILAAGRNPEIRRVIVDVRMNGGGNNQTYRPLLRALATPAVARKAYLLQGRVTFSAAGNFVTEVDLQTKAKIVGEPSGGAPNQWGDNELVELPRAGLTVRVASSYWVFGRGPKDARVAVRPDIPVTMTAADFFAGRDPVLERALR